MTHPAIRVENLGKQYQIGLRENGYRTLRESIMDLATAPLRRLRHLSGKDGEAERIWALRDVSFDVQPGEVVGIIGRNGAGKSTLLKVLTKITEPTTGRAEVRGRVGSLLEVGTGFHQELTGRENVWLNGAILGMPRTLIKRKFDEIVDFSGVEKFLDTPVKRYSSGMRVRLAFAVAAHLDPEILLIDEVLAVGDAGFQKKCLGKMKQVARGGRTVLFVSHNMPAIQSLCTRGILLEEGRVSHDGPADDVVKQYLLKFERQEVAIPVAERTDRGGSGDIRFTSIEIIGTQGQRNVVAMGDALTISMSFECRGAPRDCNFGFHIINTLGQVIYRVITRDTVGSLPDISSDGRISCTLPRVSLVPGHYSLTLVASSNLSREAYDHVRDAAAFEVLPNDVYGTGKIPTRGVVYTPCSWSLSTEATGSIWASP